MKVLKSIQHNIASPFVNMGPIRLRQPLPSEGVENVDPFILLHHYGPYAISEFNNPFDLGPHPHRGFEPITLLFKGEQFHRDSLGNEMVVKAGDVQWTTAGHGIVHAEAPTKEFVKKGGTLEGIQLWLNLPAKDKLMPPNYQHLEEKGYTTGVYNVVCNIHRKKVFSGLQADFKIHEISPSRTELKLTSTQYSEKLVKEAFLNFIGEIEESLFNKDFNQLINVLSSANFYLLTHFNCRGV